MIPCRVYDKDKDKFTELDWLDFFVICCGLVCFAVLLCNLIIESSLMFPVFLFVIAFSGIITLLFYIYSWFKFKPECKIYCYCCGKECTSLFAFDVCKSCYMKNKTPESEKALGRNVK